MLLGALFNNEINEGFPAIAAAGSERVGRRCAYLPES